MLFLFFLAFLDPEITHEHINVTVISSPNSAELKVSVANPFDSPIHLEGFTIQIPRYLELAFNGGSFLANMAPFSQVNLVMGADAEQLELSLRKEYQTLWPGKDMTLLIGQFSGPREIVSAFEPTLQVETTMAGYPSIPFELAYSKQVVTKKGEPAFEVSRMVYGPTRRFHPPDCSAIVTIIPPYASSGCGADCVNQPVPAGCEVDGTYGSKTVNGPFTVIFPNCSCIDESI